MIKVRTLAPGEKIIVTSSVIGFGRLTIGEKPDHPLFKDITGQKFNRLTVENYAGRIGDNHAFLCSCECGSQIIVRAYLLTGNVTKSCGCLRGDSNRHLRTTHGLSHSREWRIWAGMKNRCLNPKVRSYMDYGGRGISVCDRWLNGEGGRGGFECFYSDMGPRPTPKHSLERKNNDGNYEPGNVVWATTQEQNLNTRVIKRIQFQGQTLTSHEWSTITGIANSEINKRINRGWSVERALTQPMRGRPETRQ